MQSIAHVNSPTDHGGTIVTASTKVFCEGIGIARRDDVHDCPIPGHGKTKIVTFDPKVFADGRGVARVGDQAGCGAKITGGCPTVIGSG